MPFGDKYRGMRLHVGWRRERDGDGERCDRRSRRSTHGCLSWVKHVGRAPRRVARPVGRHLAARVRPFGAIALTLATVGVYGLRAYLVDPRTREIGVRIALGATRHGITAHLLREGGRLAAAGLAAGAILATGVVQLFRGSGMLVDAELVDPAVSRSRPPCWRRPPPPRPMSRRAGPWRSNSRPPRCAPSDGPR